MTPSRLLPAVLSAWFAVFAGFAAEFTDFSGVCQGAGMPGALGWNRHDFHWDAYEPAPGDYRPEALTQYGQMVLDSRKNGMELLPIFSYSTNWSHRALPYQYQLTPELRATVHAAPEGGFLVLTERRAGDGWTKVSEELRPGMRLPFSPEATAHWVEYVTQLTTMLRQQPYGLEYFQIWNEAWPTSGFFDGNLDDYMTTIHLPAARAIHAAGGKVVYGGWACAGDVAELVALLDRHDAWDSIDVIDLHYFPLQSMEYLRQAMAERHQRKAIWQTELGFTADCNFIGNLYPRVLAWALANGLANNPDFCKLFYFAQWSPDDPKAYGYGRTLYSGDRLSRHGVALQTLAGLLGGGDIGLYESIAGDPQLQLELDERQSSLEAFQVADRIVVAVHMIENNSAKVFVDWNGSGRTIHLNHDEPVVRLTLPELDHAAVVAVERVSMLGERRALSCAPAPGGGVTIDAPIRDARTNDAAYIDMPEDVLPQVFYLNITLQPGVAQ